MGSKRVPYSTRSESPSVLRVRADCGGRLFTAKLVVVHYLTHHLLNHLLANGAVLTLPPPIPVQRSHGFTRPTTRRGAECAPPTVKPLYLQTYFRLAASGLRGEAAANNQSLRLHRPQATVSPTAVSYSFLIRSLRPNRTGRINVAPRPLHRARACTPNDPPACPPWGRGRIGPRARRGPPSVLRARAGC